MLYRALIVAVGSVLLPLLLPLAERPGVQAHCLPPPERPMPRMVYSGGRVVEYICPSRAFRLICIDRVWRGDDVPHECPETHMSEDAAGSSVVQATPLCGPPPERPGTAVLNRQADHVWYVCLSSGIHVRLDCVGDQWMGSFPEACDRLPGDESTRVAMSPDQRSGPHIEHEPSSGGPVLDRIAEWPAQEPSQERVVSESMDAQSQNSHLSTPFTWRSGNDLAIERRQGDLENNAAPERAPLHPPAETVNPSLATASDNVDDNRRVRFGTSENIEHTPRTTTTTTTTANPLEQVTTRMPVVPRPSPSSPTTELFEGTRSPGSQAACGSRPFRLDMIVFRSGKRLVFQCRRRPNLRYLVECSGGRWIGDLPLTCPPRRDFDSASANVTGMANILVVERSGRTNSSDGSSSPPRCPEPPRRHGMLAIRSDQYTHYYCDSGAFPARGRHFKLKCVRGRWLGYLPDRCPMPDPSDSRDGSSCGEPPDRAELRRIRIYSVVLYYCWSQHELITGPFYKVRCQNSSWLGTDALPRSCPASRVQPIPPASAAGSDSLQPLLSDARALWPYFVASQYRQNRNDSRRHRNLSARSKDKQATPSTSTIKRPDRTTAQMMHTDDPTMAEISRNNSTTPMPRTTTTVAATATATITATTTTTTATPTTTTATLTTSTATPTTSTTKATRRPVTLTVPPRRLVSKATSAGGSSSPGGSTATVLARGVTSTPML